MKKIFLIIFMEIFIFAKIPNHLLGQTSPYLKQHIYNPVNWYPWGKKAFLKAKQEHKPIFLSIGYSTCHWCHVMEKESFENKKIAKFLNKYFISIEVDAEEMPNVDKYYQRIYQKIHKKRGGWPLNIILSENKKPFFIAKYIPPENAYGVFGLDYILPYYGKAYQNNKNLIKKKILLFEKLIKQKKKRKNIIINKKNITKIILQNIYTKFDKKYKGFGFGAKYPNSAILNLLFDIYKLTKSNKAKKMALETLTAMANSSIYDQIGGGFFRYTTDRAWSSPHFEKMLYSNAQILPLYIKAYKMTNNQKFKEIVTETLRQFNTHFKDKKNMLYFSASNADSDNMDGGYYLYKYSNALNFLNRHNISKKNAKKILKYLDIQKDGNYDSEYALAKITNMKQPKNYKKAKEILRKMRERKTFPSIDKKIILSWNAMMIKSEIEASCFHKKYLNEAIKSLKNLQKLMQKSDGTLYHQTFYNKLPSQNGMLEDYAYLIDTLLEAYQKTFNQEYLNNANKLAKIAIKKFYNKGNWILDDKFKTKAGINDNYYTSAMSIMVKDLLYLALYKNSLKFQNIAKKSIFEHIAEIIKTPSINPQMSDNFLKYKKGLIAIKSSKNNLIKFNKQIKKIKYPFLTKEVIKSNKFLCCSSKSCFGYGSFKKIRDILNKDNDIN